MSLEGLEHFSKDQLIAELINRQTFAGVVIWHRGDAKAGQLDFGEVVMTKSPPLTREGVEHLLQLGQSLVSGMFGEDSSVAGQLRLREDGYTLRLDDGGVLRVGKSRISLDLIVGLYENGMTPEDIVRAYDTLVLADVYAAIAYYLRYRDEIQAYLTCRGQEAGVLRATVEAEHTRLTPDELLTRSSSREQIHAPAR
jgi:uncharacterized protein (DUF433 family)